MPIEAQLERWIEHLAKIKEWLEKDTEASKKRAAEHIDKITTQMKGVLNTLEDAAKPRKLADALLWVEKKGKGSYLALLDQDQNLIRTVLVSKDIITPVEPAFVDEALKVEMTKRTLQIADLDFKRNIPKKVTMYQWLISDGTKVTQPEPKKKGK